MAAEQARQQQDDKPLDPAVERVRRKLIRFVAINLGILFIALMAVVVALVYRSGLSSDAGAPQAARPASPPGETFEGQIVLPAGARILSHSAAGDRLSLHAELAGGAEAILVYDMIEGRMVARFDLVSR